MCLIVLMMGMEVGFSNRAWTERPLNLSAKVSQRSFGRHVMLLVPSIPVT